MNRLLRPLRDAFHDPEAKSYRAVEAVVWLLIVFSIGLFGLELWLGEDYPGAALLGVVDQFVLLIFGIEIALRVLTFTPPEVSFYGGGRLARLRYHVFGRIRFLLRPMNLIDLLTVAAVVPYLRGLRAFRLLRLLRSIRIFKYSQITLAIERAFSDNALLYGSAFSVLGLAVLVGGTSIFLVETRHEPPNPDIHTIADGLWWAIVTLTTVGFGDISPISPMGRILAAGLMVFGMFMLALFAGIIGNTLLDALLSIRKEQFRMGGYVDHIVVCGYNEGTRLLLDALSKELDPERVDVVLFALGDRPRDVPPAFHWVTGDPQKESELDKVRLAHARAAIIVGTRDDDPQTADATTILTVFTVRSWLDSQPVTSERSSPLYVVAEILEDENVVHARTAGADEVIETNWIGFSMMAHAVSMPGTAKVVSQVAISGQNNVYVAPSPEWLELPCAFGDVVLSVKRASGALVIGWRLGADEQVNPDVDAPVPTNAQLVYLAKRPVLSAR